LIVYLLYFILYQIPSIAFWINSILEICHSVVPIILLGVSIYIFWRKKFQPARFYIAGWSIFLISAIIIFRIYGGQINYDPVSFFALEFGSAAEALIFSFALADRIREMNKEKRQTEKKQMELERINFKAELTALKAQMNPHFVFNSLSSLQSLISANKREEAIAYIQDFSKLTRQTLNHATKNYISLDDEIQFLKSYINLELLRYDKPIEFEFNVSVEVETELELIPPMIIQPYIENAFKHGLSKKENGGRLTINFYLNQQNLLICEITDNGLGRKKSKHVAEKPHPYPSKGTHLTTDRLNLLNSKTNTPSYSIDTIDIYDLNGVSTGTKVVITFARIPFNTINPMV
ncbi:MAG: histidine kinase, partial [Cytophagales bacterium]|nr:histidine kinase [Cytophagales bacterium]